MDLAHLETFVFEKMAATRMPGLSLALVRGDEIVYARGFGQRDMENGLPATPDTLYGIASVTKSFTALAILQLAQRGLLDPDDPVDRFLPFPIEPKGEKVRLSHLMSHTSGIPALAYSEALIGYANGTGGRWLPIAGPEDVLTFMDGAEDWVENRPGLEWAYSNEGYALLGLIVEKVSGRSYDDYLRTEILEPLGMERSFIARSDVERADDVAVPYVLGPNGEARPGRYLYRRIRSEGGLMSCVTDLARYLAMFLSGRSTVAGPELLARMLEPRVDMPHLTAPELLGSSEPPAPAQSYAFGLALERFLDSRLVSHSGNVLVSTAHIAFMPEEGVGVAVLSNCSGYPMGLFARAALAAALGRSPEEAVPALALEAALERLCGRYRAYRGTMEVRVERHGNFLMLHFADGGTVILVPETPTAAEPRFHTFVEGRRLPVSFRFGERGIELLYERYKLRRSGPA